MSSYQLSAAELFRLSVHRSETTSRRTWHLLSRCLHFVGGSKRISSQNHFLAVPWTLTNPSLVVLAVVFTTLATLKFWLIDWLKGSDKAISPFEVLHQPSPFTRTLSYLTPRDKRHWVAVSTARHRDGLYRLSLVDRPRSTREMRRIYTRTSTQINWQTYGHKIASYAHTPDTHTCIFYGRYKLYF